MKDGDFVHLEYTGRIREGSAIFDTTIEEVAKKENSYNPQVKYRPVPVIVGASFVFKGLEDELKGMNVGERKTIEVASEKAFGARRTDLVRMMPLSEFRNKDMEAAVGRYVNMNGINGKIISISGGRVTVDFNHPLAGKDLVYELEVKDLIESAEGKVKAIVSYFTGGEESTAEVSTHGKTLRITAGKEHHLHSETKAQMAETIRKWVGSFERIEFVDVY